MLARTASATSVAVAGSTVADGIAVSLDKLLLGSLVPIEQRITAAIAAGVITEQPVRPLAMILLMLVNDTALMIAAAADRAVARRDAGAALAQLISGLRTDH